MQDVIQENQKPNQQTFIEYLLCVKPCAYCCVGHVEA